MNSKHLLTVLVLATAILYAQSIFGANSAILDTDTPVLAKIVVSDINSFASQWNTAPVQKLVKIAGKDIRVVTLTIDNIKLQGRSDGATAELYYRGPASALKVVAKSPYVKSIFIKAMPEIPPRDFFTDIRTLAEKGTGAPQPTLPVMRDIIGATRVEQLFGVNGTGVVIAVVDTGVDYGHPDLQEALAWLIKTTDGREIIASSISPAGTALQYKTLRGQTASIPLSQVATVEPLVLDADESQVLLLILVTATSGYLPVNGSTSYVIDGPYIYIQYRRTATTRWLGFPAKVGYINSV